MDATLHSHIEALAAAVEADRSSLTDIRPPVDDAPLHAALDRQQALRGRKSFLPFLGTGRGWGPFVESLDGSVKLDMVTGIGVHGFGHGDPELLRIALEAAVQDTVMQGNLQCNSDAVAFVETLLPEARTGESRLEHVFPCCSGAVANETALKICMQKTGAAPRVLAFEHCFAGRTTTMSQIGHSAGAREGIALNMQVDYLNWYDPTDPEGSSNRALATLQRSIRRWTGQHACIVLEPIQGEGGFAPAPVTFLRPLLETARESGIPVWFDEVQTFGRTETMFRQARLGLEGLVDVVTVGKLSQVCAAIYTADMNPRPGLLSGTFIGSTAGFRVGRALIKRLRDGGYYGPEGRIAALHAHFMSLASALMQERPGAFPSIRGGGDDIELAGGCGGMMRLTPFGGDKGRIIELVNRCFDAGLILFFCGHGPVHLRMLPPVGVLEPVHLDTAMGVISGCIDDMERGA